MSETAQMDKLMTEISGLGEEDKRVLIHRIEELLDPAGKTEETPIESVFGIWKDRDITLENLWQRVWFPK